jgi:hypothetical protein
MESVGFEPFYKVGPVTFLINSSRVMKIQISNVSSFSLGYANLDNLFAIDIE